MAARKNTAQQARGATPLGAVVFAIFLATCPRAFALNPSLTIGQYAHTAWTNREGFTKGAITAVAQTPDGYLWLGTGFGLLRFDGVRQITWLPPTGQTLPSDLIGSLLTTRDGSLFIGTANGVARWTGATLVDYPQLRERSVVQLLEGRDGTVWARTFGVGGGGRLCAIRQADVRCDGEDGRFGDSPWAMHEDERGNLWVSVWDGLWRWHPGPPEFFPMTGQRDGLQSFLDLDGDLVVGTANGIRTLRDGKLVASSLVTGGAPFRTSRLLRDRDGGLWIGTHGQGLLHLHDGRVDSFTHAEGLSGDNVWTLFEDREGNVWVTTTDGLDRFRAVAVSPVGVKLGLASDLVNSVLAARDGSVWIATDGGLNHWMNGRITRVPAAGNTPDASLPERKITALFEDDRGRIWASQDNRIGSVEHERLVTSPFHRSVHEFAQTGSTTLWANIQGLGLVELAGTTVVRQMPWATIGHTDSATAVAVDRAQNGVWMGFQNGGIVYVTEGQVRASYAAQDGLGAGRVSDLLVDDDGTVWASTASGLSRLKNGRLKTLTSKDGLPCDAVHWALRDDLDSWWLYQPCGLVRIPAAEVNAWAARSDHPEEPHRLMQTTVLDGTDGVPLEVKAVGPHPQVTKSLDGKLWFVSASGLSVLDPRHVPFNPVPPPVHVERITADRHDYDNALGIAASLRLPPRVRDLEIDYTAPSLAAPEKVRFRYKLEGWDRAWQDAGNRRQAFYTNLPPRPYRFRVIASNDSGVWNEVGASVEFSIVRAYYQTPWFPLGIIVGTLALLLAAYRFRLRQLATEFDARLQERLDERSRIARELHDTLLQSFHGVMFRFQAAANVLPDRPVDARDRLDTALKHGTLAIREGRDAIQNLRASTKEASDLAIVLSTLGEELAARRRDDTSVPQPGLQVDIHGTPRSLRPIVRDEIYRIAGEALRNAFTHANARRIELDIHFEDRRFQVRVRDDGKGISEIAPSSADGHFGLPGMRERAELIGGRLEVWSQADLGTEIALTMPAATVYGTARSPLRSWLFAGRARPNT